MGKQTGENSMTRKKNIQSIVLLLIIGLLLPMVPANIQATPVVMVPHPIYGEAYYNGSGAADGAYVLVSSTLGSVHSYVGPSAGWGSGFWQVDIGDPGPNWPVGTAFTVTITDNTSGWVSDTITDTVASIYNDMGTIILNPPTPLSGSATADGTLVQIGQPISFTGTASGGATPYTWAWDFDDGNTSSLQNPTHSYNVAGTYEVTFSVTDDLSNIVNDSINITVLSSLVVSADASITNAYIGESINFNGIASGGSTPYSWHWDFDDGASSNVQNPTHHFSSAGTYNVLLTVTDNISNIQSDSVSITVLSSMSINAFGPYSGLVFEQIEFQASADGGVSPYTFNWSFGDGTYEIGQNVNHTYLAPGIYEVLLTARDNDGVTITTTTSAAISTDALIIDLISPASAIEGEYIQFNVIASNGVEPYSFTWDFGDGISTSNLQSPTYTYTTAGQYQISVVVTDYLNVSANASATITIEVDPDLTVLINGPYSGVVNTPIDFSGSVQSGTPPFSWYWDFGDNSFSTEQNPQHTYILPGQYTVTLQVTDNQGRAGSANTTVDVTTNYPPARPTVSGTFKGKENNRYSYTIFAKDPEGEDIYLLIDWGDGQDSEWLGPYRSGEYVKLYHSWNDGSYLMKTKAKDIHGAESEWTTNEIIMPILIEHPWLHLLEMLANRFPFLEPLLNLFTFLLS